MAPASFHFANRWSVSNVYSHWWCPLKGAICETRKPTGSRLITLAIEKRCRTNTYARKA